MVQLIGAVYRCAMVVSIGIADTVIADIAIDNSAEA